VILARLAGGRACAHLTCFRSADVFVGEDLAQTSEADKNVGAPVTASADVVKL
jgi:hypothetical protein